jgi:NAD(P)-dependent dehydrogenase (short-subunit alcohol dehydrogenase family)
MTVLREQLLDGVTVAVVGGAPGPETGRLKELGATMHVVEGTVDEQAMEAWARERAPLHLALVDARRRFASGGGGALRASLENTWCAVRALATCAMIATSDRSKITLLAPAADAGLHAAAARAALVNLARTLSVEWARYQICTTAILPGPRTTADELGELVAFLASPAGDYFSGCRFDLGAVDAA